MCCVCIAPPLARQSLLYNLDMDWIREGKMTTLDTEPGQAAEAELKILSDTMADLVNLSSVLHSLQIKLSVARHKTNPKVFMWCNVWDETALGVSDDQEAVSEDIESVSAAGNEDDETDEVTNNLHLVKKELENHLIENNLENQSNSNSDMKQDQNSIEANIGINGISEVKIESKNEDVKIKSDSMDVDNPPAGKENGIEHDKNEPIINENENKIEQNTDNADEKSKPPNDNKITSDVITTESQNNFNSQLVEYLSSDSFDIQTLLPSVSEMQRMLPDVIKDISGSLSSTPSFSPNILPPAPHAAPPNIIPEPKRLDRDECRQNLVEHIELLQKHVEDRLEAVEAEIEMIEKKRRDSPGVWSGLIMSSKLQSVKSAKIVNSTVPDRG